MENVIGRDFTVDAEAPPGQGHDGVTDRELKRSFEII